MDLASDKAGCGCCFNTLLRPVCFLAPCGIAGQPWIEPLMRLPCVCRAENCWLEMGKICKNMGPGFFLMGRSRSVGGCLIKARAPSVCDVCPAATKDVGYLPMGET